MKKLTVLGLAVVLAGMVGVARAEAAKTPISVGLWAGYTTVGASDLNKQISDGKDMMVAMGVPEADIKTTKFGGGLALGIEGTYAVAAGLGAPGDSLGLGLRVGYLMPSDGEVKYDKDGITVSMKAHASAIPIELGVRYAYPATDAVVVSGGLFAGLGMVSTGWKMETKGTPADSSVSVDYAATTFALDVLIGAGYKLTPEATIGLDLGYRMLSAAKVTATKDVADAGVAKGDAWKNSDDKDLKIDLSGLLVALNLSYSF